MAKNYAGIARYQPLFPQKDVADVFEAINGTTTVFFTDGTKAVLSPDA